MFILLAATELLLERKMQQKGVSHIWILDLFRKGVILKKNPKKHRAKLVKIVIFSPQYDKKGHITRP